jgi:N-acetylglutamate synthase-like GNAT family acetyltransferase
MYLRDAEIKDGNWVYDILEELRHPVYYSEEQFKGYFEDCLKSNFFKFLIFCDSTQNEERLGLVSLNKFYMPRYLGFGYEMEELVIHKDYRGKGLSYKLIEAVKASLMLDSQNRKLIIKTNGEDSMHIYAKALNETDLKTYQVYLNKL